MEFANVNKVYRKSGGSPTIALTEPKKALDRTLMAHKALKAHISTQAGSSTSPSYPSAPVGKQGRSRAQTPDTAG
jgi:hypothetical protein